MLKQILAADIGGTHSRFLLASYRGHALEILHEQHYPSQEYADFTRVLDEFMRASQARPDAACIAVAGPVQHDEARVTNLPWVLNRQSLATSLALPRLMLINDFAAQAYALGHLPATDLLILQPAGGSVQGNKILLGAGTGLGLAQVIDCNGRITVLPSEGGHMDFAPHSQADRELLQFLSQRHAHVSWEKLLSGSGLVAIYQYYLQRHGLTDDVLPGNGDAAPQITHRAMQGEDEIATEALLHWLQLYGSCAGNLALLSLPQGGVYVAGGIAAKLVDWMRKPEFIQAFNDKPPMQHLLRTIPVYLVNNPRAGLLGAAWHALEG